MLTGQELVEVIKAVPAGTYSTTSNRSSFVCRGVAARHLHRLPGPIRRNVEETGQDARRLGSLFCS